ncbi:MAG: single-stranded-DNA-specific exonuclease RecJ [Deltaproteobacteria bacterium]|nr:single-stranded-DNA-specific exonuclease RecJ [Deltaproteobacteria bacterium]
MFLPGASATSSPPPLPRPPLAWSERAVDDALVHAIADQHALPRSVARVVVGRGVASLDAAALYLRPSLKHLPDPLRLAGVDAALDRIEHALVRGERIGVFGDYDVDGVTSTTLLTDFLEAVGGDVICTIPDRLVEGYGLSKAGVDRLVDGGCRLIVTVDCGVTNHDEVAYAAGRGVDVIVVDHHTVPVALPRALSVINPHRPDCTRGSEMLCAVGVTFNLALAVRRRLRERGWFSSTRPEPDLRDALDLVALGTVADVVPLVGENRVLVHAGLQLLRQGRRPGMRALLEVAGVEAAQVAAGDLGYQVGPRVNAAGRLGDAMQGVRLLKSGDDGVTRALAAALDAENAARRDIEKQIIAEAIAQVEASPQLREAHAVVVGDERWHPGVVGIVASRLVDRFGRPAVVFGQGGRGSARSVERLHLHDALSRVRAVVGEVIAGFGGHHHAAGVRLAAGGLERFRDAFLDDAAQALRPEDLRRVAHHDGVLDAADLRFDLVDSLKAASPFGRSNPEPAFVLPSVRLRGVRVVGSGHLKGTIDPASLPTDMRRGRVDVIAFGAAEREFEWQRPVDLLGVPERNEFNGATTLQVRVRDFRPSSSSSSLSTSSREA